MATCLFAQDFIASGYSLVHWPGFGHSFHYDSSGWSICFSCAGSDPWVAAAGREKKRERGGGEVRDRQRTGGGGRGGSTCRVSIFVRSPYTFL